MAKFKAPNKIYFYDISTDQIVEYLYDFRATWYHYNDKHGEDVSVNENQIFFKDNLPDNDYLTNSEEVFFTKKETCIRFKRIYLEFCLRKVQVRILNLSTEARLYSDRLEEIEHKEAR